MINIILLTYLATSYSFSGAICSLAFLRYLNEKIAESQLSPQHLLFINNFKKKLAVGVAVLWPLWMIWESFGETSWQSAVSSGLKTSHFYPSIHPEFMIENKSCDSSELWKNPPIGGVESPDVSQVQNATTTPTSIQIPDRYVQ